MKKVYLIGGTMGVGKTAVCKELKTKLPNSVFLDGDWCWDASPFQVTEETKEMVMENIIFLLNQFIKCSAYENVIFGWVMHEQSIIDDIESKLNLDGCKLQKFSLLANEKTLTERLTKDVKNGLRTEDVIARSTSRIPLYEKLETEKIVTDGKTVTEVAEEIMIL